MNLISGTTLDHAGYESHFENAILKLTKGCPFISRGKACNIVYKTHVKLCKCVLNAIEVNSSLNLWHKILGHMNEKGLHSQAKKD